MTDNEITIKALKELLEVMLIEGDLQRTSTISHTIDLINRQNAEIERLRNSNREMFVTISKQDAEIEKWKKECQSQSVLWRNHFESIFESAKETIKAEAIKEFAERLKADCPVELLVIHFDAIDNLVKEMVGDDDGNL